MEYILIGLLIGIGAYFAPLILGFVIMLIAGAFSFVLWVFSLPAKLLKGNRK